MPDEQNYAVVSALKIWDKIRKNHGDIKTRLGMGSAKVRVHRILKHPGLVENPIYKVDKVRAHRFFTDVIIGQTPDEIQIGERQCSLLVDLFNESGNPRRFLKSINPWEFYERKIARIAPDVNRAEIWYEELESTDILKNTPIGDYYRLFIDRVEFRRREKDSDAVARKPGHYVSLTSVSERSDGAVVLLADEDKPRVLLISQWRHNAGWYLVEAVRGLPKSDDTSHRKTANRERKEETFIGDDAVIEEVPLGRIFTDSGMSTIKPGFFLQFVDAKKGKDFRNLFEPTLEDPVWVSLASFYKAVFTGRTVRMKDDEFEFLLKDEYREILNTRAPINKGKLRIRDAFTICAAARSLPYFLKHYRLSLEDLIDS